jgi:hypothetical protein
MPDAKLHEPLKLKPPFVGFATPGRVPCPAMTGKRGPANSSLTASSFKYAAPVPIAQRRGHQHPACGRIAVRHVLDDLERRHGVELEPAAQRARRPHAEQPFAVQRFGDRLGELAELLALCACLRANAPTRFARAMTSAFSATAFTTTTLLSATSATLAALRCGLRTFAYGRRRDRLRHHPK